MNSQAVGFDVKKWQRQVEPNKVIVAARLGTTGVFAITQH